MPSSPKTTPNPPPPPPSFPQTTTTTTTTKAIPQPPHVPPARPAPASLLVELLTYGGAPFKDHWAYWVGSRADADVGVKLHATGDVAGGFVLEAKRGVDLRSPDSEDVPGGRVALQWVDGEYFGDDGGVAMMGGGCEGVVVVERVGWVEGGVEPVCGFEGSACKVPAPGKTLNDKENSGEKVTQRDCQTWIVESAGQLVRDGIFRPEVAEYLRLLEQ